jgi:hypothetical protein
MWEIFVFGLLFVGPLGPISARSRSVETPAETEWNTKTRNHQEIEC